MSRDDGTVEVATARRRRFTREEYHRMGEVGIPKPTDRVELIRGEIVQMSPIGRRHAAFVDNLIEVAETSLAYDRSTRLRLYAETGIPEYWIDSRLWCGKRGGPSHATRRRLSRRHSHRGCWRDGQPGGVS